MKETPSTLPADPVRSMITERCRELDISHAELSRLIGRGASYINQYLRRGSPVALDDRERVAVAKALKLDEDLLRPDAKASSGIAVARQQILARSSRHLPVFRETAAIDFEHVTEWTERPDWVAMSEQSFALWIEKDHGRLLPGDLAYVTGGRPPRLQDLVAVLTMDHSGIVDIGTLAETMDDKASLVLGNGGKRTFNRRTHIILKVAAICLA